MSVLNEPLARPEHEEKIEEQRARLVTKAPPLPFLKVSDRFAGLRVKGVVADTSACGFHRIINPLHILTQHGAEASYSAEGGISDIMDYDVVLFPRQHNKEIFEAMRYAQWEGKTCLFEIDDDLDNVHPNSPAYATYHQNSPESRMIHRFIRHCHGMTASTPEIARYYYQDTQNVAVVENFIDFSLRDWNVEVSYAGATPLIRPLPPRRIPGLEDKIVIGWQGGGTHAEDLAAIGPTIASVLRSRPNVAFAFYGSYELMMSWTTRYDIPKDQVHHVEARPFWEHPTGLHGVDIGLAPILCSQFNLAKSTLKVLEGMAAGAAMIGSNVGPYARFERRHPGSILTVGQGKWSFPSWGQAIVRLLDDPDLLREMKVRSRQLMIDRYALERNVDLWPTAWASIVQRVDRGLIGPPAKPPVGGYKSYGIAKPNDPCPCGSGAKYKRCCKEAWG